MHELLLHAPVPSSRQHQVLSILAGLAAMQPVPLFEQIQLYKPNRIPEASRAVQVGAVQGVNVPKNQSQLQAAMAGDLFYLRIVQELREEAGISEKNGETAVKGEKEDNSMDIDSEPQQRPSHAPTVTSTLKPSPATSPILQFHDVPEPTRQKDRAVTSRLTASIPITTGSPGAFMAALNYTPVSIYYTEGHRLSYNDIDLRLYRVLIPSPSSAAALSAGSEVGVGVKREELRLLDESGGFVLQAAVRVADGSKVETMVRGGEELWGLRDTLRGVVELEVVERLALDTRVR